ncbi:lysophospholipid acyltransferase family protein [Granulicoccus sp. GXG6511]|uniref:lysophospholipid acyltransferase family protein n=1 Tax=Granulicoccus sp. GXG6511 TaxID=3381351 RepID=UPI003D7E0937
MGDEREPGLLGPEAQSALEDFLRAGGVLLERLKDLPTDQLGDLLADPVATAVRVGKRLGVEWQGSVEELAAYARSRLTGDYAVDEFGFDPEFTEQMFLPVLRLLADKWFRLELRGIENIPLSGSALLVSNHAGALPLDALVLQSAVFDATGRHSRMLGADLVFTTPFSHDFARRIGATVACAEDAARLLEGDNLVSVFPEGFKGLGKKFTDRYRLQRFGRGGFVSTAVRSQVPIVPVSIVGSEEIYPLISDAPSLARALGFPYFPVTPLFPWFGVLGMIPLPSKWIIEFGEAVTTDELPAGAADDPATVLQITDQVRITIQNTLYKLLDERPGIFF